jgi:hypothetical protein
LFDEKACLNETPSGCWETPHATDIYHARELKARRNQRKHSLNQYSLTS